MIRTEGTTISTLMSTSTTHFAGLEIEASRDGDHVTGVVRFPYEVGGDLDADARAIREGNRVTGRTECPIDYYLVRPGEAPQPAKITDKQAKANRRAAAVKDYQERSDQAGGQGAGPQSKTP